MGKCGREPAETAARRAGSLFSLLALIQSASGAFAVILAPRHGSSSTLARRGGVAARSRGVSLAVHAERAARLAQGNDPAGTWVAVIEQSEIAEQSESSPTIESWGRLAVLASSLTITSRGLAFTPVATVDGGFHIESSRAVAAVGAERTTLWVESVVRVIGSRFVLVVPLSPGTAVDPGEPDWFSSVEAATAPRVLPPTKSSPAGCPELTGVHDTTNEPHAEGVAPIAVDVLSSFAGLLDYIREGDLALDDPAARTLEERRGEFLVLEYPVVRGAPLLVSLRVREALPLGELLARLSPLGRLGAVPLTLVIIAVDPVLVLAERVLSADEVETTWLSDRKSSDYPEARSRLLDRSGGDLWIREVLGKTALFESYFPDASSEVPAVPFDFGRRLEERGYGCPDWYAAVSLARAEGRVAPKACAAGSLARMEPTTCVPTEGSWDPDLRCEGIDDLALAFSGAPLNDLMLTRYVGQLPTRATLERGSSDTTEARTVKLYADTSSGSLCDSVPQPVVDHSEPPDNYVATSGQPVPPGSQTDGVPRVPNGPSGPDIEVVVAVHSDSCGSGDGSGTSSEGACSGSSSSDTESDGEACSGDSTSDYESDGETCSGDSTSDHESSDETCSGDSSSEADGETCSGDGGSEASCSSDAGGGGECTVVRARVPRPRLSVLLLALAALALPLRRRQRTRSW